VTSAHEPGEAYAGPAELAADDSTAIAVEVHLRGHVDPNDGRFHWYGRISPNEELAASHRAGTTLALRTPHGIAAGRIADVDPWGRFRITGLGTPPF
jgi:hypothetical protein